MEIVALVVALVALLVAVLALRRTPAARRAPASTRCPRTCTACARRSRRCAREGADALRHLAVVRYDAFGDMGGHLSWSVALLDDGGDGVVLTSIHGRSEARTYAKNITGWTCEQQLSPEEVEAIAARPPADLGYGPAHEPDAVDGDQARRPALAAALRRS